MRLELDAHEADLHDLDAYGRAQERFEALGGWALEARLDEARRRLDIEHLDRGTRLGEPVRRRGGALPAGRRAARRADRPAARRADQPPRRRRPRVAGGVARRLPRHAADDLARPRLPRRDGGAHLRALRGRPRGLRGRLHRLSRGARAAPRTPRAGDRGAGQVPAPARGRHRDDARARPSTPSAPSPRAIGAEAQALREEGGEEVQGARAPAAARDGLAGLAARAARPGRVQGPTRERRTAGGG